MRYNEIEQSTSLFLDIIHKNRTIVLSKINNHKNRLCEINADYANSSRKKDFMVEYNTSSGTDKNKSWEDTSSPRQRTRIFLRKTWEDLER